MAYTLAQATKLVRTALQTQIVETLVGYDALLANLPIVGVDGNAIVYSEELALSSADHIAINGTITAATPTYNQRTKQWKQVLSDQSVAKLVDAIGSGTISQVAEAIRRGTKACAREIMDKLINGDEGSNPEEVDGLFYLCDDAPYAAQNIEGSGTFTARALSYDIMDSMIDEAELIDTNKAAFIMSRRTRKSLKALYRAQGGTSADWVVENNGVSQLAYGGIPVYHNAFVGITDNDSGEADNDEARIYLVSFEEDNGMCLFAPTNRPQLVDTEIITQISNQDNMVARSKAYYGMAVRGPKNFSFCGGIVN